MTNLVILSVSIITNFSLSHEGWQLVWRPHKGTNYVLGTQAGIPLLSVQHYAGEINLDSPFWAPNTNHKDGEVHMYDVQPTAPAFSQ